MPQIAVIVAHARTPRCRRKGKMSSVHPIELLAAPLTEAIQRGKIAAAEIADIACGVVTQTGEQGWCVARASSLAAGIPQEVPAYTINRLCGSGLQAIANIASNITAGHYTCGMASGVEHMTRVPMFSDVGGQESQLLKSRYPELVSQGVAAERIVEKYQFTREQLDTFSLQSHLKASAAIVAGSFSSSLVPVTYIDETGAAQTARTDDAVRADSTLEKLASLKPAFKEGGSITAGNSSSIVDGAASMLITSEEYARQRGLKPLAAIRSFSAVGSDPYLMLTGPAAASRQALKQVGLSVSQIDLWEINEAFAPIPLLAIQELGIDPNLVNVNGGAIALGHPLGATGVILTASIVEELIRRRKKFGCVSMCIGLGMAVALVVENLTS